MKVVKWISILLAITLLWVSISIYGALNGWWLSPIVAENDVEGFVGVVKEKIRLETRGNTALVVMTNGEIIAEDYFASSDAINENTLFPLASMSKLFAAYGVMQLVEDGKINLDEPVSSYLTRWKLPDSNFDNDKVTVRQLLSHTSGLSDGLGFGNYEPSETIPSLEESLNKTRASNGFKTIELGREPGSEWEYSGGGYLIVQLLVEETSGMSFESWMQQAVFTPLGMYRSTYNYLGDQNNISNSYHVDGQLATTYRYASAAATGLSSTPADMSQFVKTLLQIDIDSKSSLKLTSVKTMRQPHGSKWGADIWGLGTMLYAPVSDGSYIFGHDGANDPAINTSLRINPVNGDAIIVLATGNKVLASSVAYEWTLWQTGYPDFLMLDKAIKSAFVPCIIGVLFILLGFILFILNKRNTNHQS